ncbi:hypothetical protein [Saccharopolyspora spinosa]|uniref:hypothetical protein n=1 Tax=Saccharopolyspora spinosa TaxID=60894 RepID=UPI000A013939|nr:hypothetical protein [Saccharopolyspora spinosa]
MRRTTAAVGSAVFFVLGPGTVTVLVPRPLTGWQWRQLPYWLPVRVLGALLIILVRCREEPVLVCRFGAEYERYRRAVPAWVPRLRPWHPPGE